MSGMYTSGLIGLTEENVGIDRRFYTNRTDTNPTLAVSYNNGRVDVYLNGVKLVGNHAGNSNHDYTMDNVTGTGTTITLATGVALVASDVLELVGYVSNSSNTVQTYNFNVTTNTTAFTASHTASSLVNVYLNGVLLDSSDYTLNGSDTVTLGSNAVNGDVVAIQVIGALDHSNFVPKSGGTFSGDVDITNAELEVSNTGTTGNIPTIRLKSTEVNVGNGDVLGQIDWKSADSSRSGNPIASIKAVSSEADGSHTDLTFSTGEDADVASERMRIDSSGNVGVNQSNPVTPLHIGDSTGTPDLSGQNNKVLISKSGGEAKMTLFRAGTPASGTTSGEIVFGSSTSAGDAFWWQTGRIRSVATSTLGGGRQGNLVFSSSGTNGSSVDAMTIESVTSGSQADVTIETGNVVIGTVGKGITVPTTSQTFTVKGIDEAIGDSQSGSSPDTTDSDSGQFAVYNGSTKLFGITEHGYVLKPNHPIFVAKFDGFAVSNTQYTVASVYSVGSGYNQGGHFTSTGSNRGRFTAPVSGWYHFYQSYIRHTNSGATVVRGQFFINGAFNSDGTNEARVTEAYSGYTFIDSEAFFKLSAGDYVEARWRCDSGTSANIYDINGANTYNMFAGYLIG